MDTNQFACHAEYLFALRCMEQGFQVSMPLLHTSVYDIIVDTGKSLSKIQVKSSYQPIDPHRKTVSFAVTHRSKSVGYKVSDIDFLALYADAYKGFFIVPYTKKITKIRVSLTNKYKSKFNNFVFDL